MIKHKKLLSFVLAAVMVVGMLPLNAIADDQQITHIEGCSAECADADCACTCHEGGIDPLNEGENEGGDPQPCETCGKNPCECEDPKEPEVCETCGKNPCECEDPQEPEVCETCGKNPCECEVCETCGEKNCEGHTASVYEQMKAAQTLKAMFDTMMMEENNAGVYALTYDELTDLIAHADALYAAIEEPTVDDDDYYDLLSETLTSMLVCPECGGEMGEHEEGCPRGQAEILDSDLPPAGTISGDYTLTKDVQLLGELTVPAGVTATIDLNGYALIAAQNSRVITNNGTLTIKDSDPNTSHYGTLKDVTEATTNHGVNDPWTFVDAVWVYNPNENDGILIRGGIITGGYAEKGAGIHNKGTLNLESGTLVGNHAHQDSEETLKGSGGAVCNDTYSVMNMTGGRICYNAAGKNGGGVRVYEDATFNMYSGRIDHNYTNASGGGVNVQGTSGHNASFYLGDDEWLSTYARDSTTIPVIEWNGAYDTSNTGNGGGVHVDTATFVYYAGTISYNTAYNSGGGIYVYSKASLNTISQYVDISYNEARAGGGIRLQYGDVTLNGGTISNNHASVGGGVHVRIGNFIMNGGTVEGNESDTQGGGIYISAQNNKTPHWDDGISSCSAIINGGTFTSNKAEDGGGVFISIFNSQMSCNVEINGGTFSKNSATNNGGGICLEGGILTITNTKAETIISENTAGNLGGAAYVTDYTTEAAFSRSESQVGEDWEKHGSRWFSPYFTKYTPAKVDILAGSIIGNSAKSGGAIYVNGGNINMNGGTFTQNKAAENGGAAFVSGGDFTMTGGTIGGENAANSAVNGGGVYVTGGSFNMISGSLIKNVADSHGGGAFVHGGNITIGVKDCSAEGIYHSVEPTDKTHPEVKDNEAVFGGGLAVDGGNVDIYCGKIVTNQSMNNGTGMNIFMYDSNTEDNVTGALTHHNGTIGTTENHGMVVIGGELTVPVEGEMITINYHGNDEEKTLEIWVSEAPESYYLNLPYCPQNWEDTQNALQNPLTFVGWTVDTETTSGTPAESVDLSFIRDKNDYKALGDPVEIKKKDWKEDKDKDGNVYYFIDFYAVWAPMTNHVSYEISQKDYGKDVYNDPIEMSDENNTPSYAYSETSQTITMTNPSIPGYNFIGWKLTPSKEKISNWSVENNAKNEEVTYLVPPSGTNSGTATLAGYGYKYENGKFILTTDRNFGDITMTALFVENPVTYTYNLVLPDGKENAGTMKVGESTDSVTTYTVTVGQVNGMPDPATVEAAYGFKVKGWFTDEQKTIPANVEWVNNTTENGAITKSILTPGTDADGLYQGGTFYAVIEYHLADLIISKTATGSYSGEQTFIFNVYEGTGDTKTLLTTVTLQNNGYVTIKDLIIGTEYTVEEVGSWSWRFEPAKGSSATQTREMVPVAEGAENTNKVSFTNEQQKHQWLTHDTSKLNRRDNKNS